MRDLDAPLYRADEKLGAQELRNAAFGLERARSAPAPKDGSAISAADLEEISREQIAARFGRRSRQLVRGNTRSARWRQFIVRGISAARRRRRALGRRRRAKTESAARVFRSKVCGLLGESMVRDRARANGDSFRAFFARCFAALGSGEGATPQPREVSSTTEHATLTTPSRTVYRLHAFVASARPFCKEGGSSAGFCTGPSPRRRRPRVTATAQYDQRPSLRSGLHFTLGVRALNGRKSGARGRQLPGVGLVDPRVPAPCRRSKKAGLKIFRLLAADLTSLRGETRKAWRP